MSDTLCKLSISEPTPELRTYLREGLKEGSLNEALLENGEADVVYDRFFPLWVRELSNTYPGVTFTLRILSTDFSHAEISTYRKNFTSFTPEEKEELLRFAKREFGLEPSASE